MLKDYTTDEYWNLYENLPLGIQGLFWEDDIDDRIEKIADRFHLNEPRREKVIRIIAHLFFGITPLSQIRTLVKEETALGEDDSEKLSNEIIRFIIYPIQHLLREVHDDEEFKKIGVKSNFQEGEKKEQEERSGFGDIYREPIE